MPVQADIEHQDTPGNEGLEVHDNIGIGETVGNDSEGKPTEDHHVVPLILPTWRTGRWVDFDFGWLLLRDASANGVNDQDSGLNKHRLDSENILPLFDSVQAIQEAVHRTSLSRSDPLHVSAIYHAFSEISKAVVCWQDFFNSRPSFQRRNRFFYALWKSSQFWDYEDEYQFIVYGPRGSCRAFHCQNMKLFITSSNIFKTSAQFYEHRTELDILSVNRWGEKHPINPDLSDSNLAPTLPLYLKLNSSPILNNTLYWQYSQVLMKFFKYSAGEDLEIAPNFLHVHYGVIELLERAASVTVRALRKKSVLQHTAVGEEIGILEAYRAIFVFIGEQLNHNIPLAVAVNSDNAVPQEMSYFFYISAIYVRFLKSFLNTRLSRAESWLGDIVNLLLPTMQLYKEKFPGVNKFLEDQFAGEDDDFRSFRYYNIARFSKRWWAFFDVDDLYPRSESPSTQEDSEDQFAATESSNAHTGPAEVFEGDEGNQAVSTSTANDVAVPMGVGSDSL
ncbi:hypothetical protein GALMADRAFT_216980 [Galerina marginata CBS 339.88]|uniref:Uncharacterized protein n=1 Tax=Galerina marginata (strain CBS 339.88) TaxID=685588 RepID=A0A067S6Y1_GALM3|nr:hypothetical protein GALMADRAFT_216980 [Galerina marginata CBS 339.88]